MTLQNGRQAQKNTTPDRVKSLTATVQGLIAEPVVVKAPSAVLDINVDGNVAATGTVMDAGGNSNHHSH